MSTATVSPPVDDDYRRRWQALPLGVRYRAGRKVSFGRRPVGIPADLVAWLARRQLRQIPMVAGAMALLLTAVALSAALSVIPWATLFATISPLIATVVIQGWSAVQVRRLASELELGLGGLPAGVTRRPTRREVLGFALVFPLIVILIALGPYLPVRPTGGLDRQLTVPAEPPERLVDGSLPGAVPARVVAAAPGGGPVLGARRADGPLDAQPCPRALPQQLGVVVGPASVSAVYRSTGEDLPQLGPGEARVEADPLVACDYDADGRLLLDTWLPDGRGPIDRAAVTRTGTRLWNVVLVPPDAAWAVRDQGDWNLAVPVAGLPVVALGVTYPNGPVSDPTIGQIVFVDDAGRVVGRA